MSAFLVALVEFRAKYTPAIVYKYTESGIKIVPLTSPFLRLELTQVRVCSFVFFFHPPGCVLCGRNEMCNTPGWKWEKKTLDESLAFDSLV